MEIGGFALVFGICVVVPVVAIALGVLHSMKKARMRHEERMAMIERGLVPPPQPDDDDDDDDEKPAVRATATVTSGSSKGDPVRSIAWAVGLVVAGVLWLLSEIVDFNGLGILLTGIGAMYLTRGILGLRRENGPREGN